MPRVYLIAEPSVPRHNRGKPRDTSGLRAHGEVVALVRDGETPTFNPEQTLANIDERLHPFDPDVDMLAWVGGETLAAVLTGAVLAARFFNDERDDLYFTFLRYERGRAQDGTRTDNPADGARYVPVRVPLFPGVLDAQTPNQESVLDG